MKNTFIGSITLLALILIVGLYLGPILNKITMEGFTKYTDDISNPGLYPLSVDKVLLDDYPQIGKNETSTNNYSDNWWKYPIFTVGSYKQITNNLRYRNSPDDGGCIRADMCGALYHNNNNKTNTINPLPQAEEGDGARVGYFRSEPNNLFFSIPDNENILY